VSLPELTASALTAQKFFQEWRPFLYLKASALDRRSASGRGQRLTSVLLQPGIHQIHLSGHDFLFPADPFTLSATLDGVTDADPWFTTPIANTSPGHWDIVGGDRLISVGQANTVLQIISSATIVEPQLNTPGCELVITKLQ
jgi:hypothetical protein